MHEKGQQVVQGQSITMEKSWVMMKDRTDKEHELNLPSIISVGAYRPRLMYV